MREHPILFSAPMVNAILQGRKSQTRRVLNPQPSVGMHEHSVRCPYGQAGDRLWVKEAWRVPADLDGMSASQIADQCLDTGYCKPWAPIEYVADGKRNKEGWWQEWERLHAVGRAGRYRHARFMPHWASRITLEVMAVRVERLHEIRQEDCFAEGIDPDTSQDLARAAYENVWNQTTGDWDANPWVWVVEFNRIADQ